MPTEIVRTTLVITAGPSIQGRGADWYVLERVEDGDGGYTEEPLVCGGTRRGPLDHWRATWFAWVRRQVGGETKYRIAWEQADVESGGAGDFTNEHAGIRVVVPATRRVRS